MENCLITKLKGIVSNNNLPMMGMLRIQTGSSSSYTVANNYFDVSLRSAADITIKDGYFVDSSGTIIGEGHTLSIPDSSTPTRVYVSNTDSVVFIPKKYLYYIETGANANMLINVSDSGFIGEGLPIRIQRLSGKFIGDASRLRNSQFEQIICSDSSRCLGDVTGINVSGLLTLSENNNIKGNLGVLANRTTISNTNIAVDLSTVSIGNIIELTANNCKKMVGNISAITVASLKGMYVANSGVSGTIESCVEKLWASPISKRSGTVDFNVSNTNATFNSRIPSLRYRATFSTSGVTLVDSDGVTGGSYDGSTWTYTGF